MEGVIVELLVASDRGDRQAVGPDEEVMVQMTQHGPCNLPQVYYDVWNSFFMQSFMTIEQLNFGLQLINLPWEEAGWEEATS